MGPAARRTAWVLVAALACLYAVGEWLLATADSVPGDEPVVVSVAFTALTLTYLLVGGLVLTRLPAHPVGWLLAGTGALMGLTSITYGYAAAALDPATGSGPALATAAAWISSWSWTTPLLGLPPLLLLLFPDGQLLGPRWRGVLVLVALGLGLVLTGASLADGGLTNSSVPAAPNPLGVLPRGLADVVTTIGFATSLLAMGLATWSLVLRLRRARGVEREQVKWLVWSASLLPLYLAVGLARWATGGGSGGTLAELGLSACLVVVPLAVGAAILRYRLYDIDLVINRTLVYGALTVTLALTYLGSVLVLQSLLRPIAASSDLTVAASTLVVAGVFGPVRRWIQGVVDRRFYRRRYDAVLTLGAFSARLRDQVDVDAVGADLLEVVRRTVEPTAAAIWLAPPREPAP